MLGNKKWVVLLMGVALSLLGLAAVSQGNQGQEKVALGDEDTLSFALDAANAIVAADLSAGSASKTYHTSGGNNLVFAYSGAAESTGNHVTLANQGYVSLTAAGYGLTGIKTLTAVFDASVNLNNGLYLQVSTDAMVWDEAGELTSAAATSWAKNYRYFRLLAYTEGSTSLALTSVSLTYSCAGVSASEDVDLAHYSLITGESSTLSKATAEATTCYGESSEAIRVTSLETTRTNTPKTVTVQAFDSVVSLADAQSYVVTFDYYYKDRGTGYTGTNQLPYVMFFANGVNNSSTKGTTVTATVDGDWLHCKINVSDAITGTDLTKTFNQIAIYEYNLGVGGYSIIDNLYVGNGSSKSLSFAVSSLVVGPSSTATIAPKAHGGALKGIAYVSAQPSIATVDANGVVTGVAIGTTTISATARIGSSAGIASTLSVEVKALSSTGNRAQAANFSVANSAAVAFADISDATYGSGVSITTTDAVAEGTYVANVTWGKNINLSTNQSATISFDLCYSLAGSYYGTNGIRYKMLKADGTNKVGNSDVQGGSFTTNTNHGNGWYTFSTTLSLFGNTNAAFTQMSIMFRPAQGSGASVKFCNLQITNISE